MGRCTVRRRTALDFCGLLAAAVALFAAAFPGKGFADGAERAVRVGVWDNPPIVFRDAAGRHAGIAIDVLEQIARAEGWELVYEHAPWGELLERMERGEIDLLTGIGYSAERARRFVFTGESLIGNWGVVYKGRGLPIASPLDLANRRVAFMRNAIHSDAFADLLRRFQVRFTALYTDSYEDALKAVATGAADAAVVNRVFGTMHAHRYAVDITGIVFNPVYVHYAGHAGTAGLVARIDGHLARLKAQPDSPYYASLERWLTEHEVRAPTWLPAAIAGGALALTLVGGGAWLLRMQVQRRTRELALRSNELEAAIEQRREAQERLKHFALYDALTGLPNRASFLERFPVFVAEPERQKSRAAVLFIDIDHLKTVNESLGHAAGDELIRAVAERLRACLRANDSIFRFGGDEFLVAANQIHSIGDAEAVASRLLRSLKQPVDIAGRPVYASASIGIAVYPDDETTVEGLLKCADAAMYHAKEHGRNRYQLYRSGLIDAVVERLDIDTRLRQALERAELTLHYQPIVALADGRVIGTEALIRWNDPEHGLMRPDVFIPHAERSGAIVPVGAWVLSEACRQAIAWHQDSPEPLSVSVNVSARQFQEPNFVGTVEQALVDSGLPPSRLQLEITEGLLLVVNINVADTLHALKRLGVRLSIDDFGTGYSSLAYLKQLPIDVLKIDRSFVAGIPERMDDAQIATTIITMAHGLGLRVVAEGIETERQVHFLREHGCDYGQGYFIARPLPEKEIARWFPKDHHWRAAQN